ncbi:39S ribosomal protein L37, mitochondrial-like [Anneissia japonica]|uniref:39S ribosomal protein L37, mitochondrial-like n=1 Tax=Anneissia japonica TaxID=1529436 RepID=UPI001425B1FF|nr:39S ribosomal protein L37, mitochondrial-like [Anneissia japonica]
MATCLSRILGPQLHTHPNILLMSNLPTVTTTRGYKKPYLKAMRDRIRLNKRTLPQIIEDNLDLPRTVPRPFEMGKEDVLNIHPKYAVRVNHNESNEHYKKTPVYIFNQLCVLEEGMNQALWLTNSKLMDQGKLPEKLQKLGVEAEKEDMTDQVYHAIKKSRHYDTTEKVIRIPRYSRNLVQSLLTVCNTVSDKYPRIVQRTGTDKHYIAASWQRGNDPIQVRGHAGTMISSAHPIAPIAGKEEIEATRTHQLPTFHPISPTIDLLQYNVYKLNHNFPGYFEGYPYQHAHTLYVFDDHLWTRKRIEKGLHAKGIMFAFGNALARARLKYGIDNDIDLETPIVTQSVATDGVNLSFVVVQLNTLRMTSNDGIKNMVWLDADNQLYNDQFPQDIKIVKSNKRRKTTKSYIKKMITKRDPEVGCQDLDMDVFRKFLSLHVHGAEH